MDNSQFSTEYCLVPVSQQQILSNKLEPVIKKLPSLAIVKGLENGPMLRAIRELVEKKKKHNPAMMIVVGIGGSNLGAQAVYEDLYGTEGY